jgi:hypothetical protein
VLFYGCSYIHYEDVGKCFITFFVPLDNSIPRCMVIMMIFFNFGGVRVIFVLKNSTKQGEHFNIDFTSFNS